MGKAKGIPFENTKDEEGVLSYWVGASGQILLSPGPRGQPLCSFCGIASHPRQNCAYKRQFRLEGKNDFIHPQRGTLQSKNSMKKQMMKQKSKQ